MTLNEFICRQRKICCLLYSVESPFISKNKEEEEEDEEAEELKDKTNFL